MPEFYKSFYSDVLILPSNTVMVYKIYHNNSIITAMVLYNIGGIKYEI